RCGARPDIFHRRLARRAAAVAAGSGPSRGRGVVRSIGSPDGASRRDSKGDRRRDVPPAAVHGAALLREGPVMTNSPVLAVGYLKRCRLRVRAVEILIDAGDFADAVREAQETVELAVKAVLKLKGLSPTRGRMTSLACCATPALPARCSGPTSSAGSSTRRSRSGAIVSSPSTAMKTSCR